MMNVITRNPLAPVTICPGVVAFPQYRMISREGVDVWLPPQLFVIFMRIARAPFGVTPQGLFDELYGSRPDGGPLTGRKSMMVQRINLNRRLQALRLHIDSPGSGVIGGVYKLLVRP